MERRILEIRERLMRKQYALGSHTIRRISEQNIQDIADLIYYFGSVGEVEPGFNQKGICWTFDCIYFENPYRLVVGPHRYDKEKIYIISLFRVDPMIRKGKNYQKFNGKTLSYTFEFEVA